MNLKILMISCCILEDLVELLCITVLLVTQAANDMQCREIHYSQIYPIPKVYSIYIYGLRSYFHLVTCL